LRGLVLHSSNEAEYLLRKIEKAFKTLDEDEKIFVNELNKEIEDNINLKSASHRKREFCFRVIFSPDRIKNPDLMKACRDYINLIDL
jgi:restriction endonuclease